VTREARTAGLPAAPAVRRIGALVDATVAAALLVRRTRGGLGLRDLGGRARAHRKEHGVT
jgi:hypothetical protein